MYIDSSAIEKSVISKTK